MRKHLPRTEIESALDKFAVTGGKIDSAQSGVRFTIAFLFVVARGGRNSASALFVYILF